MKKIIRLTEGDLHRLVKESVKKCLKEYFAFGDSNNTSEYDEISVKYFFDATYIDVYRANQDKLNAYFAGAYTTIGNSEITIEDAQVNGDRVDVTGFITIYDNSSAEELIQDALRSCTFFRYKNIIINDIEEVSE